MENNNIFYNYIYFDPRKPGDYVYGEYHFDHEPFYVGKGSGERYNGQHNKECEELRKEIRSDGLKIICKFLHKNLTEDVALYNETELIQMIGRKDKGTGPLLNKKERDQGNSGFNHTDETKRKISESNKGEKCYMFGKHHTDETKRKISESNKGKKHTDEAKRKISEKKKGRKRPAETKRKISETMKDNYVGEKNPMYGKYHTDEAKRKMSEAKRGEKNPWSGKHRSDETRRKMSESHKGKRKDGMI